MMIAREVSGPISRGEAGAAHRAFERPGRGGGDVGQGRRFARLQPRPEVAPRNPEMELLAINGARVVAGADGQWVERLVRNIDRDRIVQRSGSLAVRARISRHVESCLPGDVNSQCGGRRGHLRRRGYNPPGRRGWFSRTVRRYTGRASRGRPRPRGRGHPGRGPCRPGPETAPPGCLREGSRWACRTRSRVRAPEPRP